MPEQTTAGGAIAEALRAAGTDRAFLVPGESYLPVLEGMRKSGIAPIVCRNEGGAAYMALADSALTGRPGVAMVTRGPGAANAMVGVSAAWQDGVPMLLLVGLVTLDERDRFSFQEFDLRAWYGTTAKRVFVLDTPDRAYEVVEEAIRVSLSGRPGPVVIGLPEDVIDLPIARREPLPAPQVLAEPNAEAVAAAAEVLEGAERPLIVAGGHSWSARASADLARFAERHSIPVLSGFRAGLRVPGDSRANAGWIGFGTHPEAWQLLAEADALLVLGTALGDVMTRGWRLTPPPSTAVVNPDPELRGHASAPLRHVVGDAQFAAALLANAEIEVGAGWSERLELAHGAYLRSLELPETDSRHPDAPVRVAEVIRAVNAGLPERTTVTYGAGQHCLWPQRFLRKGGFPSELGLQNGSMGYSVPAAVAASLRQPDRTVVCVAGDGELLMNGQELATAVQHGASMLLIIVDNGTYGTIREHQASRFPGTRFAVDLQNPDFTAWVRSFGGAAFRVETAGDVDPAVSAALEAVGSGGLAAIHILADELDIGE